MHFKNKYKGVREVQIARFRLNCLLTRDSSSDRVDNSSDWNYDNDDGPNGMTSSDYDERDDEQDAGADDTYKLSRHLENQVQDEENFHIDVLPKPRSHLHKLGSQQPGRMRRSL